MYNTLLFKKYLPEDFDAFHDLVKTDDVMKYIRQRIVRKSRPGKNSIRF
jgi:hypothetical protein